MGSGNGSPRHMNRDQFRNEMDQVKETSLGLEMVNHVNACSDCKKLLEDAQVKVVRHIRELS